MELVQFLKENSLYELQEQFAIEVRRHQTYPHLVALKYSQLNSPMAERIAQQCRGIILNEKRDWEIVSYPFDKFFNFHEGHAAPIDWDSAKVYEKLDGSLMVLYFYKDEWSVSSSGIPDASGRVKGEEFTMAELFWDTWNTLGYQLPSDTRTCYIFEMLSPEMQIIVRHEKRNLVCIGARNLDSLLEIGTEEIPDVNWKMVKTYDFASMEAVLADKNDLNPLVQEGYIVRDANFNRVKIKSPQYVKIGLLDGADTELTTRYLIDIIRINEGDEFLAYYPSYEKEYRLLMEKYQGLVSSIASHYESVKEIEDKKTFALACKEQPIPSIFFRLRNKQITSIRAGLAEMNIRRVVGIMASL